MEIFNPIQNESDAKEMAKDIIEQLEDCEENDQDSCVWEDIVRYRYYTKEHEDEVNLSCVVFISKCKDGRRRYFQLESRYECNDDTMCGPDFDYTENRTVGALAKALLELATAATEEELKKCYREMDDEPIYDPSELPVYKYEYNFSKKKVTRTKTDPDPEGINELELIWNPEYVVMYSYSKDDAEQFCKDVSRVFRDDCDAISRSLDIARRRFSEFDNAWRNLPDNLKEKV